MKRLQLLILAAWVVIITGCPQPLPPELQNRPPDVPEVIYPINGADKIPTTVTLKWKMSDPNVLDTLFCDLFLGENQSNLALIKSNWRADTFKVASLKYSTQYYWKVNIRDHKGLQTEGPVWTFQTRVEHNNPPYAPDNPNPPNHDPNVSFYKTTFSWKGGDPDDFSKVLYDVYFGLSVDSLKLLKTQIEDTSFTRELLLFDTKYFWQVIAKDDYDSVSAGPVWDFTTEKGTLKFWEPFETYPINQNPPVPPWTVVESKSRVFITDEKSHNGAGKSICFVDSTEEGTSLIAAKFEALTKGMISFYWQVANENDYLGVRLYAGQADSTHLGPQISIRGNKMQFYSRYNEWVDLSQVVPDQWYFVQLLFSCEDRVFHVYVNGELKTESGSWTGGEVDVLDSIYFLTFKNRICQRGYVDEIKAISE